MFDFLWISDGVVLQPCFILPSLRLSLGNWRTTSSKTFTAATILVPQVFSRRFPLLPELEKELRCTITAGLAEDSCQNDERFQPLGGCRNVHAFCITAEKRREDEG